MLLGALGLTGSAACVDPGESRLGAGVVTQDDAPFGPRVVFDPLALPVPEVPFPNDLLLNRVDSTETGLSWNITENAATQGERDLRSRLNELDGFGVMAPITVSFDGPLDLDSVNARSVLIVNVEASSPRVGEVAAVDLSNGYYPLDAMGQFWPFDAKADLPDFLLPEDNAARMEGVFRRVTHYEVESNTLILRPLIALAPRARYAVLITRDVLGQADDGSGLRPVRSPFLYKAHAAQVDDVVTALDLVGLSPDDLAFGWTFTTADPAAAYVSFRAGLYGEGPLARLADDFPASLGDIRDSGVLHDADGESFPADPRDHRFIVQGEFLGQILGFVGNVAGGFSLEFDNVDYLVFGSLTSPDIRTGKGRTLGVNPATGVGEIGTTEVPYLIAIPRETAEHNPPFPVVFYFHGTGTSRFEFLALGDNLARQGIATVAFDAVGHGPLIPDLRLLLSQGGLDPALAAALVPILANLIVPARVDEFAGKSLEEAFEILSDVGFFAELAIIGRTEDATGDGALESGESFFFANPFKQCAAFQQDLIDFMQFVRVIRSLNPDAMPPAIENPADADDAEVLVNVMAGDFNADGVLDIGGPGVSIGVAGTSLGGLHSVLAGVVEPEVETVTPIAAGGGLTDILLRSDLRQITRVIYLEVFGPLVVGCSDGEGGFWLSFNDNSNRCRGDLSLSSFAHLDAMTEGTVVTVTNLANSEQASQTLDAAAAGFSLAVEADRWDTFEVLVERPGDVPDSTVIVQTPHEGIALERNTPEFRRFIGITQQVLDRCDPAALAHHLFLDPLPGHAPKSVLFEVALQDETVPISSAVTLARTSGALGRTRAEWEPRVKALIDAGVVTAANYDVDDALNDNPADQPAIGPFEPVPSGMGVSTIRFADVRGRHEWIAGGDDGGDLDAATYSRNRMVLFHASGGSVVEDDTCIAVSTCPLLD